MPGLEVEGDGSALYTLIIDESKNPKEIVQYLKLEGEGAMGTNSVNLANFKTLVKTLKSKCDAYITAVGAIYTAETVKNFEE